MITRTATLKISAFEEISVYWLALGSIAACASVLLAIIFFAKPFVDSNDTKIRTAHAKTMTVTYTQAYSTDSASLYPPLPMAVYE